MRKVLFLILIFLVIFSGFMFSQNSEDSNDSFYLIYFPSTVSNFRFNFINPGGRATGMGGAFIAVANDATASETNPAGLIFIPRPMVFSEYRRIKYTFDWAYDSDQIKLYRKHFYKWVNSPTFLSFVYPKNSWAIAIYRQELANFQILLNNKDMLLPSDFQDINGWFLNKEKIYIDFHLTNYGISFAKKFHETFAAGISIRAAHLDFNSIETVNLDPNREVPPGFVDTIYILRTTTPDFIGIMTDINDEDWKLSYVVGCQWRPIDKISIGVVYRYGAKHHIKTTFFENLEFNYYGHFTSLRKDYDDFEIDVPDRLGFGFSLLPNDKWTVSLDIVRIYYSDLNQQFLEILSEGNRKYYGWEDNNEYRFGIEYTIPIGLYDSLSLRVGYYASPDPSFHYLENATPTSNPNAYYVGSALCRELGYDHHATFGVGLVAFKNWQIDFAGDLATRKDLFVFSCMYNF